MPRDWTSLFDDSLFKFDTSLIPEAVALYDKLGVKKVGRGGGRPRDLQG